MTDTNLLRCLAAILIANSHIEGMYPAHWMAADGLLGDTLFFALSGFGLVRSERNARRPFVAWWARRVSRLYPSLLLVVAARIIARGEWRSFGVVDYTLYLGLGWPFVFVRQILAFYVLFYLVVRFIGPGRLGTIALALVPLILMTPFIGARAEAHHRLHWVFYFQAMLFGGAVGHRSDRIAGLGRGGWELLLIVLGAYFGARMIPPARLGPLVSLPYLLLLPTLFLLLRAARAPWVVRWLDPAGWPGAVVSRIAGASLELYLIHQTLAERPAIFYLPFPLNVIVYFALAIMLSVSLAWAVRMVRNGPRRAGGQGFSAGISSAGFSAGSSSLGLSGGVVTGGSPSGGR